MNWLLFWLYLHIAAAILAFGPTFTFPIFGAAIAKEPAHTGFALRLQERIARGMVVPIGLTVLVTGIAMILTVHINLTKTPYLGAAIVLYLIALGLSLGVLLPAVSRMIRLADAMPPGGPPPGAPPGPPPAMVPLISRVRIVGGITSLLVLVILFLMVVKPGGVVAG
jgi:hypothetical protein